MNNFAKARPAATDSGPLEWLWELTVLVALAIPTTALFWITELDLVLARLFHFPNHPKGDWPVGRWWLWEAIYNLVPIAAAALAMGAALVLGLATIRPRMVRARLASATLLLTLLIGPGLLVNVVFKDHWGHPRPRQVVGLGGEMAYEPPLKPAFEKDGRSFPCGHCSVGFSLLALWFILKRRWRRLAWMALALGTLAGLAIGVARMAAGAHFLSDVLWSGFFVFFAAWLSYYVLVRVPFRIYRETIEQPSRPAHRWLVAALYVLLAGIIGIITALRAPPRDALAETPLADDKAAPMTPFEAKAAGIGTSTRYVTGSAGDMTTPDKVLDEARSTYRPLAPIVAPRRMGQAPTNALDTGRMKPRHAPMGSVQNTCNKLSQGHRA